MTRIDANEFWGLFYASILNIIYKTKALYNDVYLEILKFDDILYTDRNIN